MRARALLAVALAWLVFVPTAPGAVEPPSARAANARLLRSELLIVAAGDIACAADPRSSGGACRYGDTAALIDGPNVDAVLTLGDNQYDVGAYDAFLDHFDPTWGAAPGPIHPVPGNHDYANDPSSNAGGYFRYFGDGVRGPDDLGYYSYDLGACPDDPCWHVIALNSMLCLTPDGCDRPADATPGRGERMWRWLRRDLAQHPNDEHACTLAYWHHPLFSFSTSSGPEPAVRPLWNLLWNHGADLVLNGHAHNYQRWAPQTPAGVRDVDGIRQIIVGTGGASVYALPGGDLPANLVAAQADSFGVLRLALEAEGYRWQFVPIPDDPAFDDGSRRVVPCR